MKFKLDGPLCKGTTLSIEYPGSLMNHAGDIKDFCWSKTRYQSCQASGSKLNLVLDQPLVTGSYLELYVENTIILPTTTTETTQFLVSATWGSTQDFVKDTSQNTTVKFTPSAEATGEFTSTELTMTVKNAGENSDYKFKFKSSTGYTVGESFVVDFPREYDPFVGAASKIFDNEDTYYLGCGTDSIGLIFCTVEKHRVTVTGSSAVDAADYIDFTIKDVHNPSAATANEKFSLSQVDATNVYTAIDADFIDTATTTTATAPANVTLKCADVGSNHTLSSGANYEFKFFLGSQPTADQGLRVGFPDQYDLYLTSGLTKYSCVTSETKDDGTSHDDWNSDEECTASRNWISLDNQAYSAAATSEFSWTINGLTNPESGLTRTQGSNWDFDVNKTDEPTGLFTVYEYWTNQFEMQLFDDKEKSVVAKSYDNLNAAYLGFNRGTLSGKKLEIDDFEVRAGTFTEEMDIEADGGLSAKWVKLEPKGNTRTTPSPGDKLAFRSDIHDFKIYQGVEKIQYRVGADLSLEKGVYYIDWKLEEEPQSTSNNTSKHYDTQEKTKVEVIKTGTYKFTVSQLSGNQYIGFSSPSIKLSLDNAPFSDVTVTLALETPTDKVKIEPNSLVFGPETTEQWFKINIDSTYTTADLGSSQTVTFTLTGTDAAVFEAP